MVLLWETAVGDLLVFFVGAKVVTAFAGLRVPSEGLLFFLFAIPFSQYLYYRTYEYQIPDDDLLFLVEVVIFLAIVPLAPRITLQQRISVHREQIPRCG